MTKITDNHASPAIYPFEIHVTVSVTESQMEAFSEYCRSIGVKPIVLDLYRKASCAPTIDVMTSSRAVMTFDEAKARANETCRLLSMGGFAVVRHKIETAPWHPSASNYDVGTQYLEAHIPVVLRSDSIPNLRSVAAKISEQGMNVHVSRNAFKRDGDTATVMVTHRTMDASPEIFNAAVDTISQLLAAHFTVLPAEREFVIVDTNLSHDDQWVSV